MNKTYLVLSSSSLGYSVYDLKTGETTKSRKRGKLDLTDRILVGDEVFLDDQGFIIGVKGRRNRLERPRLSNCDAVFVIMSLKEPDFSSFLCDKFLTACSKDNIPSNIILTKSDLYEYDKDVEEALSYYVSLGHECVRINALEAESDSLAKIKEKIKGKRVAFIGQTGVGKSTLLNAICPSFDRKVDRLYVRSGRGRHTTKEVILFPYEDSFIFDTPGFSDFRLTSMTTSALSVSFPGFEKLSESCFFDDCQHLESTRGCQVIKAKEEGKIPEQIYRNYLKIYNEVKEDSAWTKKKRSDPLF